MAAFIPQKSSLKAWRQFREEKTLKAAKNSYILDPKKSAEFSCNYSDLEKGIPGKTSFPTPRASADEESWGSTLFFPSGPLRSGTHYSNFKKVYKNPDTGFENIMESWTADENISTTISAGRLGRFNVGTDLELSHVNGNQIASRQEEKYAVYATKDIRTFIPDIHR